MTSISSWGHLSCHLYTKKHASLEDAHVFVLALRLLPYTTSEGIMNTFSFLLSLSAIIVLTHAAPSQPLHLRNPSQCDPFSSISTGAYTIKSNEWGANPSEGSQCSTINSLSGNSLSWSTAWNWVNDTNQVKSFTNVQSSSVSCKPLNQYQSIPTIWSWR